MCLEEPSVQVATNMRCIFSVLRSKRFPKSNSTACSVINSPPPPRSSYHTHDTTSARRNFPLFHAKSHSSVPTLNPSQAMEGDGAGAGRRHRPPCFLAFLGHGFAVPARNGGLFLPLLVLTACLAGALLLGNALAVQPLAAAVLLDADAVGRADPAGAAYRDLARALAADVRRLLLAAGACLLAALLAGSAIKLATVFAAVAAFSADRRATAAKGNVWEAVVTLLFGYALQLACLGATAALAVLAVVLLDYSLLLLFLAALAVLLACLFLAYLSVVCAVAVVVSAAEPGRRGAAAVSRAWRLMRGRGAQAALYLVATCALAAAVSPVYTLALRSWPRAAVGGAAAGVAYVLLLAAVEVVSVAAVTAFYFECRESVEEEEEIMAGHRYVKLPSGDDAANI